MATKTLYATQRCDCCGGDLPPVKVWEANRNTAGDCDGTVTSDGRCRAFAADDLWTTEMTVHSYSDGESLGRAEIDPTEYERLAQWPEGIIRAGDILSDEDIEALDIRADATVYCK